MTAPTSMPVTPAAVRSSGGSPRSAGSRDGAPAFASALEDALAGSRSPARTPENRTGRAAERAADRASNRSTDRASERAAVHAAGPPADRPADEPDVAVEETGSRAGRDDTAATASVVLPPGLWALLAAAAPLPAGTHADAAADTTATDPVGVATGAAPPAGGLAAGAPGGVVPAPIPVPTPAGPTPAGPTPDGPTPDGPTPGGPASAVRDSPAPAAGPPSPGAGLPAAVPGWAAATALAGAAGLSLVVDHSPAAPSSTPAGAPAPAGIELLPVTTAGSADSPDAGSDDPAGDARPNVRLPVDLAPTTDTGTVVAVPGQAPVTPVATVAPAAAPSPAGSGPPVAAQLGRQLAVLRHAPDGSQTMTVVITPENLGQVTVAVTITDGTLDLTLHGAHETGRHALAEALPELRRELESAGLSFAKLEVSTSSGDAGTGLRNAQQQLDARAGQQGNGQPGQQEPRPRTWGAAPDRLGEGGTARATDPSTSPGVDVLA